jgi:hypothetical protein
MAAEASSKAPLRTVEIVAGAALIFGLAARLFARPHAPLWIDETVSGAFAAAPSLGVFFRLISWDVNGPLYYLLLRPWTAAFGLSDGALRALSLLLSAGAPLAVALAPVRGLSRAERLTWAALVALWIPGIGYAQAAKPLALAYFLGALETVAFASLLGRERPRLRDAALWVGLACLTIEAHYDAAWLALSQGLVWLAVRRGAAVRCWPAALFILPVMAEVGAKAANLMNFTAPGVSWYVLVGPRDVAPIIVQALGSPPWLILLPSLLLAFGLFGRRTAPAAWEEPQRILALTAAASLLGLVAFAAAGALRPMFNIRYLGPFAPGVALGVLLALRWAARGEGRAACVAASLVAVALCGAWLAGGARHIDSNADDLSTEAASQTLMRAGVTRLVFVWDNPMVHGTVMHPLQADAVGGFFFHRAGRPVQVTVGDVVPIGDPSAQLLAIARPRRAAILWLYDSGVRGTAAAFRAPHIDALDPRYVCQTFARHGVGAVACFEPGAPSSG